MFAVIKTGGKQYKVAADDLVRIEKIPGDAGETVTFENVLMVGNAADVSLGTPLVAGALVAGEVVEQFRDKKVIVFKKKRRQGYRRKNGHRQELTLVRITEILTGGAKPSAKKAAAPKSKTTGADAKPAPAKAAKPKAEAAEDKPAKKPAAKPAPKASEAKTAEAKPTKAKAADAKPAKAKPAAEKAPAKKPAESKAPAKKAAAKTADKE